MIGAGYDAGEIHRAVVRQIDHGRYASEKLFGFGNAGQRIAEKLRDIELPIRKRMTY